MAVRVFTKKPDGTAVKIANLVEEMQAAAIQTQTTVFNNVIQIFWKKKNTKFSGSGYVQKSDFDALNVRTVSIPANFAGLEAEMTPTRLQDQLFRITEVVEDENYVTVTARHVWYDNIDNYTLWKPTEDVKYTGAAACRNILTNALSPCYSDVASDCTDQIIGKDLDYERKNLVECFLDPENGICAKYGLSLIRDNWNFYCLKEVGYDRGFVVENGKNLLGVERKENIDEVITRVAAYGKDSKGEIVWLSHDGKKYIDSSHIGDYGYPRVEIYDTGVQIGKDDVTAANIQAKILAAAQKRFTEDKVDLPNVEMTIQFLSLGDTEEYVQYRDLDKVYLYDIISIRDTIRGYQYTAQVVGIEHDILTGMMTSVTIGKLDNWDGTRKISKWQVPEISGENIRLKSIMAGTFAAGAIFGDDIAMGTISVNHLIAHTITADAIAAHTITAAEISSHTITSDEIDVDNLAAAFADIPVLNTAIATIAEAEIGSADIGFAQIKDADIQNLIAHDAVTDRYFIHKLMVENAQLVTATVGELIVKAADNNYYRLDIDQYGVLTPTQVTNLTSAEIAAGVTSDGRSTIIETDLVVADLSASNMKAINALIDKLTASRIDVDELFARQATITQLNTVDIRGNTYLQLMVQGYGSTYTQWEDPEDDPENIIKDGDVWFKGQPMTHAEMAEYTNAELAQYTHKGLEGYQQFIRQDGEWKPVSDPVEAQHTIAQIALETEEVAIRVQDTWEGMASLRVQAGQISARLSDTEGALTVLELEIDSLELAVSDKYGKVSGIAIESAGVSVSGNKYINLDVDVNTYVHISASGGINMKGSRLSFNGKEAFGRDDIIILSNGQSESSVISSMSGHHDWVLIKPYYNAEIDFVYGSDYASTSAQYNTNVVQMTREANGQTAFGSGASWYQYVLEGDIIVQSGETVSSGVNLALTLSNARALTSAVTASGQTRTDQGPTAHFTVSTGHVSSNLCGEGASIWFRLDTNYAYSKIQNLRLKCTCDSTTSKVPCTVYYFP